MKKQENIDFGLRLKSRRKTLHYTQLDVALRADLNCVQYAHYEQGLKMPSMGTMQSIATALRCTCDWLVGRSQTVQSPARPGIRVVVRRPSVRVPTPEIADHDELEDQIGITVPIDESPGPEAGRVIVDLGVPQEGLRNER